MGCLFGYYGNDIRKAAKFAESIDITPLYTLKKNNLFITFGGIPETCIVNKNKESGWAVLGLGIIINDNSSKIMKKKEWEQALKNKEKLNKKINGHYILVKWEKNNLHFISDPLGLKNLYYYTKKDEKVFSTRLDWIARFKKSCSIDFETFGSSWLSYNNLSYNPIIKDIKSIGPGGKISIINGEELQTKREEWFPSFRKCDFPEFENRLKAILNLEPFEDKILTLGLSGGLDSRTLLSLLFPVQPVNYKRTVRTVTIGEEENPDVEIANKITKNLQIPHNHLEKKTPYDEAFLSKLHTYISQSNIVEPASSYQTLRYFSYEYFKNKIFIDGAFGEIGRRKFFAYLLKFGRKGLKDKNPKLIYRYIKNKKSPIFRDKYIKKMEKGILEQIGELLERLPSVKDIGYGNFTDLLAVKTRPSNYSGVEQTRLDNIIVSYIPFLQKDVIDQIFSISPYWRENGRYFRSIIKKFRPELRKYPLVKNNSKIPFFLPASVAFAYAKIKTKLFPIQKDNQRIKFYQQNQEHILEILDSSDFKNFSPYNHKKIKDIVNGFYAGQHNNVNHVDWWYTFEIWRRKMGIK